MDFLRSHLIMNATLSVDHFHFYVGATTNLNEPHTLPTADLLSGKNVRAWVSMDFT